MHPPRRSGSPAIFETDRGITGQDGTGYDSADEASLDDGFPGRLAGRVFAADDEVSRVWIAGNTVIVTRSGGWTEGATGAVGDVIGGVLPLLPGLTSIPNRGAQPPPSGGGGVVVVGGGST